jgi:hypothetical protein
VRFAIRPSGGVDIGGVPSLLLEEITPDGMVNIGQLHDDGKTGGDIKANDYLYTGKFTLQKTVEGEYCYQVRTEKPVAGIFLISSKTCLWVVSFPISDEPWSEEAVIVKFTEDTSINRIKEIILTEGALVLSVITDIKQLLVRIKSDTLSNVVNRFRKYDEVEFAMPDFLLEPLGENGPNNSERPKPEPLTLVEYPFESTLEAAGWTVKETCLTTDKLDKFTAREGEKFLVCTTYPSGKTAWIKRNIYMPSDISPLSISFDYNVITQENSASLNDRLRLSLVSPDGLMTPLVANVGDIPMFDSTLTLPEGEMAIKQT